MSDKFEERVDVQVLATEIELLRKEIKQELSMLRHVLARNTITFQYSGTTERGNRVLEDAWAMPEAGCLMFDTGQKLSDILLTQVGGGGGDIWVDSVEVQYKPDQFNPHPHQPAGVRTWRLADVEPLASVVVRFSPAWGRRA